MQVEASTRAFVMALKFAGNTNAEIADLTGLPKRSVRGICDFAVNKGFDVDKRPLEIRDEYFVTHVRGEMKRSPEKKTAVKKITAKKKNVIAKEEEEEEQKEEAEEKKEALAGFTDEGSEVFRRSEKLSNAERGIGSGVNVKCQDMESEHEATGNELVMET